jgi:hypothetical protein
MDTLHGGEEALQYRALPTGAILGLVLGVLSVLTVVAGTSSFQACAFVALIPIVGATISLLSLAKIRRSPDLYTGRPIAMAGLVLSLVFLIGGVGYGGYVHLTEVPEGYKRISFGAMRPDSIEERGGVKVPPDIAALNDKKVFIKGYIRQDSVKLSQGIDEFLLVRDNQQCCFGDLSAVKPHDRILVNMVGSRRISYTPRLIRIGGMLRILKPQDLSGGPLSSIVGLMENDDPVYVLDADYAPDYSS